MQRISIVSDEISPDFQIASELGWKWGIRNFELRNFQSGRIPNISKTEERKLFALLREYPVNITALSPGVFKISLTSPEIKKQIDETLPKTYELAHRLGVNKIVVFGFGRSDKEQVDLLPRVAEFLLKETQKAKKEGVDLLLENEPGCWVNTGSTILEIVKRINAENFGINWDPANSFVAGGHPFPEEYENIKHLVKHLHIKDVKVGNKKVYVPLGEGQLNWKGQIRALIQDDYKGYYTIETHCSPGVEASKNSLEKLKIFLKAGSSIRHEN